MMNKYKGGIMNDEGGIMNDEGGIIKRKGSSSSSSKQESLSRC
jgi:hypothetical protein